jgi:hypothetical protein
MSNGILKVGAVMAVLAATVVVAGPAVAASTSGATVINSPESCTYQENDQLTVCSTASGVANDVVAPNGTVVSVLNLDFAYSYIDQYGQVSFAFASKERHQVLFTSRGTEQHTFESDAVTLPGGATCYSTVGLVYAAGTARLYSYETTCS